MSTNQSKEKGRNWQRKTKRDVCLQIRPEIGRKITARNLKMAFFLFAYPFSSLLPG
jgi:hypothetical protein